MNKPYIVAELSANHLGSLNRACDLITAAAEAGADAIKLQCFTPEQMADPGVMIESGPWKGRELLDLYRETHTPREWFGPLFAGAQHLGMQAFASVFHPDDVDFLETLNCPIYKISSFEVTDIALIRHTSRTGKRIIISTGMAARDEIFKAVVAAGWGRSPPSLPTLLKCTSAYPARPEDANLAAMVSLRDVCGCKFGLSDHSLSPAVPVAAAVLGASVIEKHLTLSRVDGGPDAAFSLEPAEFKRMVEDVQDAVAAIGTATWGPTEAEASSLALRRRPGGKRGS